MLWIYSSSPPVLFALGFWSMVVAVGMLSNDIRGNDVAMGFRLESERV